MADLECALCVSDGGDIVFQNDLYRIVSVNDPDYPGFMRLIVNKHVKEVTDLSLDDSVVLFKALYQIERVMRDTLQPDKINLASFGNVVPHLHWHIIPRFKNDRHFPNPIWGEVTHESYQPSDLLLTQAEQFINQLRLMG